MLYSVVENDHTSIVYQYDINLSGCYVCLECLAFTDTGSLPDELPLLWDIIDSMRISKILFNAQKCAIIRIKMYLQCQN